MIKCYFVNATVKLFMYLQGTIKPQIINIRVVLYTTEIVYMRYNLHFRHQYIRFSLRFTSMLAIQNTQ